MMGALSSLELILDPTSFHRCCRNQRAPSRLKASCHGLTFSKLQGRHPDTRRIRRLSSPFLVEAANSASLLLQFLKNSTTAGPRSRAVTKSTRGTHLACSIINLNMDHQLSPLSAPAACTTVPRAVRASLRAESGLALESTRNLTVVAQSPGPWGLGPLAGDSEGLASSLLSPVGQPGHGARQRGGTRCHGPGPPCHQRGAPASESPQVALLDGSLGVERGLAFMVLFGPSFRLVPRPLISGGASSFKLNAGLPVRLMAAAAHRTRQKPRRLPCTTTLATPEAGTTNMWPADQPLMASELDEVAGATQSRGPHKTWPATSRASPWR